METFCVSHKIGNTVSKMYDEKVHSGRQNVTDDKK